MITSECHSEKSMLLKKAKNDFVLSNRRLYKNLYTLKDTKRFHVFAIILIALFTHFQISSRGFAFPLTTVEAVLIRISRGQKKTKPILEKYLDDTGSYL